ncbi:MAG TPA: hypothetical protein VEY30_10850, partial [Myxococcaceae bacterium]|nr:hypothetical protein [Myxococcaceae bacterium]
TYAEAADSEDRTQIADFDPSIGPFQKPKVRPATASAQAPRVPVRDPEPEPVRRARETKPTVQFEHPRRMSPRPARAPTAPARRSAPVPPAPLPATVPAPAAPQLMTRSVLLNAERPRPLSASTTTGVWNGVRTAWRGRSPNARWAILGGAAVLGAVAAALIWAFAMMPKKAPPGPPPEPELLSQTPLPTSFGLGRGVDFPNAESKRFTFELNSPLPAVAVLHFQARDIGEGEVRVRVNGNEVGVVPLDDAGSKESARQIPIGQKLLKRGELNELTFSRTAASDEDDAWRVWNLWVEVIPLPEVAPEQAIRDAQAALRRGQLSFDRREIGPANRYQAWKEFRTAWLNLESLPTPRPELARLSREKMDDALRELDRTCGALMLEIQQAVNTRDSEGARAAINKVKTYFPAADHDCPSRAQAERRELRL